jgi:hypothetical protein
LLNFLPDLRLCFEFYYGTFQWMNIASGISKLE